jgi:hypothetical protein
MVHPGVRHWPVLLLMTITGCPDPNTPDDVLTDIECTFQLDGGTDAENEAVRELFESKKAVEDRDLWSWTMTCENLDELESINREVLAAASPQFSVARKAASVHYQSTSAISGQSITIVITRPQADAHLYVKGPQSGDEEDVSDLVDENNSYTVTFKAVPSGHLYYRVSINGANKWYRRDILSNKVYIVTEAEYVRGAPGDDEPVNIEPQPEPEPEPEPTPEEPVGPETD